MIRNCQVCHLDNPLGFRMDDTLMFRWTAEDLPGTRTDTARIVIYELSPSGEKIAVARDTGFTHLDSLTAEIRRPLKPETRYAWNVTVRTDTGAEEAGPEQYFETGRMDIPWHARWIGCDDTDPRHPVFSKEIHPSGKVVRARLYITGLGLYEASVDGQKIGNEFLTPGCNNYSSWIQVQTFDVTDLITDGCTLSVTLGNGWYKGRFGFTVLPEPWYGNSWKLLAELVLCLDDGTEQYIGTDESWQVTRSSITFSNIYDGEHRDDTLPPVPAVPARLTPGRGPGRRALATSPPNTSPEPAIFVQYRGGVPAARTAQSRTAASSDVRKADTAPLLQGNGQNAAWGKTDVLSRTCAPGSDAA